MGRLNRRQFLYSGAVSSAVFGASAILDSTFLSGCSSSHAASPASKGFSISNAKPVPGGKVTMGTWSENSSGFTPSLGRWDATGYIYANTVFDTLTAVASDGSWQPFLAASVTNNPDYTSWTIKLRPNIYFHDGLKCDASAVVENLIAVRSSFITGQAIDDIPDPSRDQTAIRALDPLTVEINLDNPWVPFPYYLSSQIGYIVSPLQLNQEKGYGTNKPSGTGPFIYKEWVPNDHFIAKKNPSYWRPGLPYLDEIEYKPIIDDQSRADSLTSGVLNLMHSRDAVVLAQFVNNPAFPMTMNTYPGVGEPDMDMVMLNVMRPPMSDPNIRLALAKAIDVKKLKATFGGGIAEQSSEIFVPQSPYYAPDAAFPGYDPAGASALVKKFREAGGDPSFTLGSISGPVYSSILQSLQFMFKQVGFNVSTDQVDLSTFTANIVFGKYQAVTFEFFSAADPDENYVWLTSKNNHGPDQVSLNLARNSDAFIDNFLEEGRVNPDPRVRRQAYQGVARRLNLDLPYLWISVATWGIVGKSGVMNIGGGFLPSGSRTRGFADGSMPVSQIWLSS